MRKIYACLIGNWVCLNDDPDCQIGIHHQDPSTWWEENAPIYALSQLSPEQEHTLYNQNYVEILYKGKDYRINPIFIQITSE